MTNPLDAPANRRGKMKKPLDAAPGDRELQHTTAQVRLAHCQPCIPAPGSGSSPALGIIGFLITLSVQTALMRCLALTALIITLLLFHAEPAIAQAKHGMQPRGQRVSGDDCFKTFNNSFRGDTLPARLNAMLVLNDSSILLAGSELTHDNSLVTQLGLLVTANKKGEVVNARHIIYKNDADLIKIIKQQDGGVVIASSASNGADYATVFSRYDKQLNLQWERFIKPPGFYSCTSDSAGNTYVASLAGQTPADQRIVITKLAADGQLSYRYALHHNNPSLSYGLYGSMCFYNNLL